MSVDAIRAALAYAQQAKITENAPQTSTAEPVNFGTMVKEAAQNVEVEIGRGEAAAQAVASGDASLIDVVTAVSAAEVTLETAIAVRNRVIEAYQEILRMPI